MAYIGKTPASAALTSSDISDGIIITDKLAANAVVTSKITDGTIATADVSDNAINLAKMASGTDGNIISYDANGNPVAIATGNDGQVLTSTGAGSPPAFENAAAGGKLLQVISVQRNGATTISSQSEVTTNISATITPSATNSVILVFITGSFAMNVSRADVFCGVALKRTIGSTVTNLQGGGNNDYIANNVFGASNMQMIGNYAVSRHDSPSSTAAVTYNLNARIETSGQAITFNSGGMGSFITLMEIAG